MLTLQSHQRNMPLHNIVAVLQYVGNLTAPKTSTFRQVLPLMLHMSGMPGDAEIDIWEEVKFHDVLMINPIRQECTLDGEQVSDGDILLLQERLTQVRSTLSLGAHAGGNQVCRDMHVQQDTNRTAQGSSCSLAPSLACRGTGNAS